MDNGSQNELTLMRVEQGGFLIFAPASDYENRPGRYPIFASSDIGAALNFIREKVTPICPTAVHMAANSEGNLPDRWRSK